MKGHLDFTVQVALSHAIKTKETFAWKIFCYPSYGLSEYLLPCVCVLTGRVSSIASADWDDCGYLGNEKGKKQKVIKTDFIPLRSELDCLISWPQGESYAAGLCRETAKNCPDYTNRPRGKRKPRVKSHSLQKIV